MINLVKKISDFFNPPGPRKAPEFATWITVRCNRCGETIRARIDLRNDLSINYDAGNTYYCRKVIIGEKRCYQPIEVELTFDKNKKIINRQISGGVFIDQENAK